MQPDKKLNREGANKVLPEGFTERAELVARLQREAHVLASRFLMDEKRKDG